MVELYASTEPGITDMEKEHMDKARALAASGMVLLENDGVLPLERTAEKIALYGSGARGTVKGGIGSGEVNSRFVVNVEQGLEDAGFEITTKGWMDRYDRLKENAYQSYVADVKEKLAKGADVIDLIFGSPFFMQETEAVTEEDIAQSQTDTAIYVIARNSGEGADRHNAPGDYQLSGMEEQSLRLLGKSYDRLIVVLNVGGVMDTKLLRSIPGIDAVLLMGQAGNIGGYALADVLTGRVTPSGKLTDTWAQNYEDYPSSREFSHNNGDLDDAYYTEGIYVGYRYFDTFHMSPAYCFGYGLSYTEFSIEVVSVRADAREAEVTVKVTNTGKRYSGREVVQVYYSAPSGSLDKPWQELAAYEKTGELSPGESQQLVIRYPVNSMASYCEKRAGWVLEAGDYTIRVGNSSRTTHIAAVIRLDKDVVTEKLKNLFALDCEMEELSGTDAKAYGPAGEDKERELAPIIEIKAADIKTQEVHYQGAHAGIKPCEKSQTVSLNDVMEGRADLDELIGQLTVEEMARICVGSGFETQGGGATVGAASIAVPGAAGETTGILLASRDIRTMVLADGPAGLRLTPEFDADEDGIPISSGIALQVVRDIFGDQPLPGESRTERKAAAAYYQYCTALPVATLLAQSWDKDLIREAGKIIGREMLRFGVTLWLAPGMNIHRNPLCGRNFEYYSEDPLISGICAAMMTEGVQSFGGIGTTVKHFAVNNQEDNRNYCNSHVGERALREIYLKGFEICVKNARPMSIMSSYNLLNGLHTANSYELLTACARDEWGFDGVVMTDWGTTGGLTAGAAGRKYPASVPAMCIQAGNDLIMPGSLADIEDIVASAGAENTGVRCPIRLADLQFCVKNILTLLMQTSRYDNAKPYSPK